MENRTLANVTLLPQNEKNTFTFYFIGNKVSHFDYSNILLNKQTGKLYNFDQII